MSESTLAATGPTAAPAGTLGRLGAWLGQERVFRWIPFVLVEAVFLLVIIIPFLLTIYISFLRWRANRPFEQATLTGFRNYEQVLTDPGFWASLGRTFYFAGAAVVFELLIGFVLAMLVHRIVRGRRIYITLFLIPMMLVPVVAGYNFSMIYLDSGPLNQLLSPITTSLGIDPRIRWLSDPTAAQIAIIIADIWQWTSLTFLIFLSGFSALPPQLINAARVMGASRRQIFFRIELPLLRPAIIIAIVIRSMEALKLFDPVVLLTFGGPGTSTQTIAYYLWEQVWMFNKFSFGAAASILLLILFSVLIFTGIWLLIRQTEQVQRQQLNTGSDS
jgi:multiple sugar transport system permease protein